MTRTFTGDIAGEGRVEYLMMYRSTGSATFVGLERVIGQVAGKAGSFVLQRTGVFEDGAKPTPPHSSRRESPMTVSDVLALLDAERDERGMTNWAKLGPDTAGMRSYGIGLTRLRKLAKRIGRNRELALALWTTDVYDARVLALLLDDPARITREQAETQVEELAGGMLAHVFASCDATLAKTSFVVELADQWVKSDDPVRRACGYGLLYEVSKFSGKKAPGDEFFLAQLERIASTIGTESQEVRLSMGAALMGIGKRSAMLNKAALKIARDVGPIEFASASGECEPFDVVKHLTTERLREKLRA